MTRHHEIALAASILMAAAFVFLGFCWGKSKSGALDGSPLGIWIGGAFSAFIGGFIEGGPIGGTMGAGIAAADGQVHADFKLLHLAIEAAHIVAIPVGTGLADVRNFIKANPFPNVFASTSNPQTK